MAVCEEALLLISDVWRQKFLVAFSEKPEAKNASYSCSGFQGKLRRNSEHSLVI